MENRERKTGMSISARSFITALAVIFCLMVVSYALTLLVPSGEYLRDAQTGELIEGSFHHVDGGMALWQWALSPILVLGASGNAMLIAIIAFLVVIGGIFEALSQYGLMQYMLGKIASRFGKQRYLLQAVILFFFMAMGAMIGSFEECVPLVPIVVALAISLGWDSVTGMGMSLLAVGCGFASGVCNPFTVGIAQELSGLPMFSGIWLRLVSFVCIYLLLWLFVRHHAKKVERPLADMVDAGFIRNVRMDRGLAWFAGILGAGILVVLSSGVFTFLQDYTMVIVALMFLVAGIVASLVAGMGVKSLGKAFCKGAVGMLPAVFMILMASSIKYTLDSAKVLDTILHGAVAMAQGMPRWVVILFIYLIVLVMNFFVASGSAKAFMLIPLIVPLARQFGISAQLCVIAFAFGDGFSNVLYPTNPALLISLGLADVGYGRWFRWSGRFQLMNLILTSAILLLGLAVGY